MRLYPEAQAMRDYLLEKARVPADAILMEDKSTTTWGKPEELACRDPRRPRNERQHRRRERRYSHREQRLTAVVTSALTFSVALNTPTTCEQGRWNWLAHQRGWYWLTAFIRESRITKAHLCPTWSLAAYKHAG